jgi:hypothetical protein
VTVFERAAEPGGQLLLNRIVPGRQELAGHIVPTRPMLPVGDCLQRRTALEAMHEAAALGHRL